jgi:phospholipid/cholesterol/gamma-HCH transport system substrate-binding protein
VPDDSSAAVASEGLLGGTYVDVQPGGSPFNLEPGSEIIDTQSAVSLVTLLLRFVTGSEE